MAREITNHDDVIDSRDVIERLEELREMDAADAVGGDEMDDDADREEYRALLALEREGSGLADWEHGETLIRDSYFVEYAQELAEDIGAVAHGVGWPMHCIDWERAARELRVDYTDLEFDGVTYWARS